MKLKIKILISIFIITTLAILLIPSYNTKQLSGYDTSWADVSILREELKARNYIPKCIVSTPILLQNLNPADTLLIVTGVEKPYTEEEAWGIYEFVQNGGKAIIADDTGNIRNLAEKFNFTFYEHRIYYESFTDSPEFVNACAVLNGKKYELVFNIPTGFRIYGEEIEIICKALECYIDWNGNRIIDLDDELIQDMPLILKIKFGAGAIVFIADPSIFINRMIVKQDNLDFILELVSSLLPQSEYAVVIFDESRHGSYIALATIIFLTSYQLWVVLSSIIVGAVLACVIIKSKGKIPWKHEFNIREFKSYEPQNIYERAAKAVVEKVKIAYNISQIELLNDKQLDSIDPVVTKIVRGKSITREELVRAVKKLGVGRT
ncbi:MAG: hypothetical protein QMD21_00220 [Candidatus Thermoplasmatota archaeon]|nr:hypothetical protein [Candidatus Thermoplasmatota archaeon]